MEICEDGHDQIVHNSRACPLCEALGEIESLKEENEGLKDELDNIE